MVKLVRSNASASSGGGGCCDLDRDFWLSPRLPSFGAGVSGAVSSSDDERMLGRYSERTIWPPTANVTSRGSSRALRSCRSDSLPAMAGLGPTRGIPTSNLVKAFGGVLLCPRVCSQVCGAGCVRF